MTPNFNLPNPPESRCRPRSEKSSPESSPLHQHRQWPQFLNLFGKMILTRQPDLRPHFLGLLDQIDLL